MNEKQCSVLNAEAITTLSRFSNERVRDVYDDHEDVSSALNVLIEDFEYPDWSHKKIGEILKSVKI